MASIRKEFIVAAPVEGVWDAIRDVGAVHQRLARDFVVETTLEPGARVVKFANGVVAKELIVDVDDEQRRVAYAVVGMATHHHATMQVVSEGERRTRFTWITDFVPDSARSQFQGMIDLGAEAMRKTLEDGD